jgi:hypothetical protein
VEKLMAEPPGFLPGTLRNNEIGQIGGMAMRKAGARG